MLYRIDVAASEFYNTQLEAEVTTRVGGTFAERATADGKRPVRELAGVDPRLNAAVVQPPAGDRHRPPRSCRPGSSPTTAGCRPPWRSLRAGAAGHPGHPGPQTRTPLPGRATRRVAAARPLEVLGGKRNLDRMVAAATTRGRGSDPGGPDTARRPRRRAPSGPWSSPGRRWRENQRAGRGDPAGPGRRGRTRAGSTTSPPGSPPGCSPAGTVSRSGWTPRLTGPDAPEVPDGLRRSGRDVGVPGREGAAVHHHARCWTRSGGSSPPPAGPTGNAVADGDVELAMLEWSANTGGRTLNTAQAQMVREVATGGRRVQLALAPAGTGKTTVMGVLAAAWRNAGGTVIGLAPQASAAEELRDALTGVSHRHPGQTRLRTHRTATGHWRPGLGRRHRPAVPGDRRRGRVGVHPEPGHRRSGSSWTGAGGCCWSGTTGNAPPPAPGECSATSTPPTAAPPWSRSCGSPTPSRGRPPSRSGPATPAAVGFYADHQRLHAGHRRHRHRRRLHARGPRIVAAGRDSIMMAPTLDLVGQLNARARADRIAAAGGRSRPGPGAGDGQRGHRVRRGPDRHQEERPVPAARRRHRLRAEQPPVHRHRGQPGRVPGRRPRSAAAPGSRCPPSTSRDGHVRLGYAHTLAGCQGMTVGAPAGKHGPGRQGTAHALLTPGMTRNEVYPGMTRGGHREPRLHRHRQRSGGDPHQVIKPESVTPPTINEIFAEMIGRDGVQPVRDHRAPGGRRPGPAARPGRRRLHPRRRRRRRNTSSARKNWPGSPPAAEQAVPGVTTAPAWETLRGHLAVLAADGQRPHRRARRGRRPTGNWTPPGTWPRCWTTGWTRPGTTPNSPGRCRGCPPSRPGSPTTPTGRRTSRPAPTTSGTSPRRSGRKRRPGPRDRAGVGGPVPAQPGPGRGSRGVAGRGIGRPRRPATRGAAAAPDRHDHPTHASSSTGACRRRVTPPTAPTGGPPS